MEGTDWKVAPFPDARMKWLLEEQGAEEELLEEELPAKTSNCLESSESSWWTLMMSRSGWRPECDGAGLGSSPSLALPLELAPHALMGCGKRQRRASPLAAGSLRCACQA